MSARKLQDNYYEINDWMCSAFGDWLSTLHDVCQQALKEDRKKILKWFSTHISDIEKKRVPNWCPKNTRFDIPMSKLKLSRYLTKKDDPYKMGKALFLDAMGFADPDTMAGDPAAISLSEIRRTYKNRLRPRHIILGRFAREGFSPALITTNYDLLLEGGYWLSGLHHDPATRACRNNHFSVVSDAHTFFEEGHNPTLIAKIHGCTGLYRKKRKRPANTWCDYLDSMVFTYREIQNWRTDSWARDYMRTLFRSHTIAFCGYSLQDTVIHDTTRTVYEEMARHNKDKTSPKQPEVPAFFFDRHDVRAFYAMEILRAASRAVHIDKQPSLSEHDNLLEFQTQPLIRCPSDEPLPSERPDFPDLDDLFQGLYHLALRNRQKQAITCHLKEIATLYLGQRPPKDQVDTVEKNFANQIEQEKQATSERHTFRHITDWTERFHTRMLRELALSHMEQTEREQLKEREERDPHQYTAIKDHARLAAWAVVVELALRNLIRIWQNDGQNKPDPKKEWLTIRPAAGRFPGVAFFKSPDNPACHYMGFMAPMGSMGGRPTASDQPVGVFKKVVFRHIGSQNFRSPWHCDTLQKDCALTPENLWDLACGQTLQNQQRVKEIIEGTKGDTQ